MTVLSSSPQKFMTSEPSPARMGRNGSRAAAASRPHLTMPSSISRDSMAPVVRALANQGS
ncbi:Uncharacterised protein [Mycobacteroides abscessus subsp. abscessus]|nr:Uncharacterised protein [Mycobacteroides abscessus subsp. abscessus]